MRQKINDLTRRHGGTGAGGLQFMVYRLRLIIKGARGHGGAGAQLILWTANL